MNGGQVLEAEALPDSAPELSADGVDEIEELAVAHSVTRFGR
jgi:hypothetical protein